MLAPGAETDRGVMRSSRLDASDDAGSTVARDQAFFSQLVTSTLGGKAFRLDPSVFAKFNRHLAKADPSLTGHDFVDPERTVVLHLTGLPRRAKFAHLERLYGGFD